MRLLAPGTLAQLAVLALLAGCDSRALDYCENSLREYYAAPGGARQAVVFDRSCGRSPSTTNLSVLPSGASIPDTTGNAYAMEGTEVLGVEWSGPTQLTVTAPARASVVKRDTLVDGVTLRYRERPPSATGSGGG